MAGKVGIRISDNITNADQSGLALLLILRQLPMHFSPNWLVTEHLTYTKLGVERNILQYVFQFYLSV